MGEPDASPPARHSKPHRYPAWALANPLRRWRDPPARTVGRLGPTPGDRVVDIGAGVGYFADEVLRRIGPSGRLVLVDPGRSNLARFEERHGSDPRVTLLAQSGAGVLPLEGESQDRVLVANVLCDVAEKRELLEEAWRLLRPGGTAYVSYHATDEPDPSRPLWVTPEQWRTLVGIHPWTETDHGRDRRFLWHVLRKPGPGPAPG